jgi:hypothetical protein
MYEYQNTQNAAIAFMEIIVDVNVDIEVSLSDLASFSI